MNIFAHGVLTAAFMWIAFALFYHSFGIDAAIPAAAIVFAFGIFDMHRRFM